MSVEWHDLFIGVRPPCQKSKIMLDISFVANETWRGNDPQEISSVQTEISFKSCERETIL